jgi:hypothetical protein
MTSMNVIIALDMSYLVRVYPLIIRNINVVEVITRLWLTNGVSRLLFDNLDVVFANEAKAILVLVIGRIRGNLRLQQNAAVGFLERQTLFRIVLDYGGHP